MPFQVFTKQPPQAPNKTKATSLPATYPQRQITRKQAHDITKTTPERKVNIHEIRKRQVSSENF